MRKNALVLILLFVICVGFIFAQDATTTKDVATDKAIQTEVQNTEVTAYKQWVHDIVEPLGTTNIIRVFFESGSWAWVILIVFLVAVLYAVIRFMQLVVREKIDAKTFHLKVKGLVKSGSITEAINAAELVQKTTMGQVYRIGLLAYRDAKNSGKKGDSLKEEVQNAFNEAAYQTIPEVDKGLHWFDLLAQTSTYLGLLGTIMGLILAFSGVGGDNATLMNGIKEAMGTTALGLIGAIVIQFFKGFLSSRAERIINDVDANSVKIMNVITNQIQE
ncbi:MAG: MotA/TolQ/ExbB proton channel family protein [Candidatus Cloacimonadales bacterium]